MTEATIRRIAIRHGLKLKRTKGPSVEFWGEGPGGGAWVHGKTPTWKLLLCEGATPLVVVEYDETDRSHSPIVVLDPRLATLEGAHVGTRFRALARLYRRGAVTKDGMRLFVDFDDPRVMFTDFYLANGRRTKLAAEPVNRPEPPWATNKARQERAEAAWQKRAWQRLLRANPRVVSIVLTGD